MADDPNRKEKVSPEGNSQAAKTLEDAAIAAQKVGSEHREKISRDFTGRFSAIFENTNLSELSIGQAVRAIVAALNSRGIPIDDISRVVTELKEAQKDDRAQEVLAELENANRLISGGSATEVKINAKAGKTHLVDNQNVTIEPLSEADALYKGTDGKIHVDEVKNTP